MRTENFSNNFNDISKIELTKMHIKSDTDEKPVCCEQNKTITKINDESTSNDVEHQNVDIFVDNSNAIVTNLNSNENTATAMEEKICELPEAECFDSTYEETESNNKSIVSVEIKTELCDDSECKYDSYLHNAENVIGKHGSELKTVSLSTISTQTKIYGDIEIKENDTEMTLNKTVCRQNKLKEDELVSELSMSTQTDDEYETHNPEKFIDYLLAKCYKDIPKNVSEAVSRMFEIDQCVLKLTNYRQSLFTKLNLEDAYNPLQVVINSDFQIDSIEGRSNTGCSTQNITIISEEHKKNKIPPGISSVRELYGIRSDVEELRANNIFQGNSSETTKCTKKNVVAVSELKKSIPKNFSRKRKKTANAPSKNFKLQNRNEKILVIKVIEDKLVAASESGKVIFYNLENWHYNKTLYVCHVPITFLLFTQDSHETTYMYVGSFENNLKVYNFDTCFVAETIPLSDSVQCMECNWGYIFIGCIGGSLLRYTLKKKVVEFEDKYSDDSILVVKATQEGARRVLLIGSRNSPVCIRDAMTGLYMRTMEDVISPTVYSLILERSLLYCGTTNHDILIYSFHNGKLIHRHKATDSKGIGCMKIDGNLLFASCHNGNIYIYDIKKNKFVASMEGPGGVILSMEIFANQVIVGTMTFKFVALPIPPHILQHKICN